MDIFCVWTWTYFKIQNAIKRKIDFDANGRLWPLPLTHNSRSSGKSHHNPYTTEEKK